jgi:hypothetical protein
LWIKATILKEKGSLKKLTATEEFKSWLLLMLAMDNYMTYPSLIFNNF